MFSSKFFFLFFIDGFADIIAIIFYDDFNGRRIIAVFLFVLVGDRKEKFQSKALTKTKYLSIIDFLIKLLLRETSIKINNSIMTYMRARVSPYELNKNESSLAAVNCRKPFVVQTKLLSIHIKTSIINFT